MLCLQVDDRSAGSLVLEIPGRKYRTNDYPPGKTTSYCILKSDEFTSKMRLGGLLLSRRLPGYF